MTATAATSAFPPGPRARWPFELAFAVRRDPLAFFGSLAAEYGDVAGFHAGRQPIVLASAPDDIRDVLVTRQRSYAKGVGLERAKILLGEGLLTSEGEFHLRQRRLVQPGFHRQRVAAYGETMARCAARERDRWRHGDALDVHAAMMRLTLAIVGRTLFGADVEAEASEVGAALTEAVHAFDLVMLPFGALLQHLPIPPVRRFRRARATLDAIIYRMIAERRAEADGRGLHRDDLLSMLLLAQDAEGDGTGMSDAQLRDEAMTLFLAGHETTANALTWALALLARHPAAEARLHAEVDALDGRLPGADDVARLPFTRAVFAESLRLFPPAWILGRRATTEVEVGGYALPAGALVFTSQWVTHRDPRWWPEPDAFRPERWLDEAATAARPKFAYYPFGAGTRVCVGEPFAWMEGVLVLATLAQRWRLRLSPAARVVPRPSITLRPDGPVVMTVERREAM